MRRQLRAERKMGAAHKGQRRRFCILTIEQIRSDLDAKNKNLELVESFTTTKKIGTYIEFDESQKKWLIPDGLMGKKKNPKVYN